MHQLAPIRAKRLKDVLTLFLCISATVASLKTKRGSLLPPFGDTAIPKLPAQVKINSTKLNSPASEVAANRSKLVWFLGSSIDQYAVKDACEHAGAAIIGDEFTHFYCKFDSLTLVYTFHPGASPGPYYAGTGFGPIYTTTEEKMKFRLKEMERTFGKFPDATIVESSIWDVANWWQNSGEPEIWPTPHKLIDTWCHSTIPAFLDMVQKANPNGRIAFRTPSPAFDNDWRGWARVIDESTDEMAKCLRKSAGKGHLLPGGKYPLIDYHLVVESTGKALRGELRDWYRDDIHPGPELGMAEVSAALKWVKGL